MSGLCFQVAPSTPVGTLLPREREGIVIAEGLALPGWPHQITVGDALVLDLAADGALGERRPAGPSRDLAA